MKTLSRIVLFAAALYLPLDAPAWAQEGPVASARSTADTDAQISQYLDNAAAEPLPATSDAARPADDGPLRDGQPHGEFGVGIGTNGYRHAHAATVVPVGQVGTAAIAVSDTRFNGRFGPRKMQSLSVAVALGDASAAPVAGLDCAGERLARGGVEPMWVTRMRANQVSPGFACPAGIGR